MDLARAPRRAPLTARKKGSGYENGIWPEPLVAPRVRRALGTRMGANVNPACTPRVGSQNKMVARSGRREPCFIVLQTFLLFVLFMFV